jgi:hypothetical protein
MTAGVRAHRYVGTGRSPHVSHYDAVSDLDLRIDAIGAERHEQQVPGMTRATTVVELRDGKGTVGRGEDVTYATAAHDAFDPAAFDGLTGAYTVDSFSRAVAERDLFPGHDPDQAAYRNYRRWAFESAALDLALRRSGTGLASALGRAYDPVRFVASPRLGDPPSADRARALREAHPDLGLKLDPTPGWDEALIDALNGVGGVRTLDLKGWYSGTAVDQPADPDLYARVRDAFPAALIEDPAVTEATRPVLEPAVDRLAWDYPVTRPGDLDALPFEPRHVNVKPSRFGSVERLFDTIGRCRDRGIDLYGGGQFELDVGRAHCQAIASLWYPDGPNDLAPSAYNGADADPAALSGPPLDPPADPDGLDWR